MTSWRCPECAYRYDEEAGDSHEGFAPGTKIGELPLDWACPDCGIISAGEFVPERNGAAGDSGSDPR